MDASSLQVPDPPDWKLKSDHSNRIRILSSPGRCEVGANPFVRMLLESYGDNVTLIHFSWWSAFSGSYDILHLHWPERVMRGSGGIKKHIKPLLFLALIIRNKVRNVPMLWTVHNDEPHEPGSSLDAAVFAKWVKSVTHKVYLSEWAASHDAFPPEHSSVILHGHYRPILHHEYRPDETSGSFDGRLLFFGFLRPYKGIESLIDAFGAMDSRLRGSDATLRIVGKAVSPMYGAALRAQASPWSTIEVEDKFLADRALEDEITAADLVVLPYSKMYNSGAVLLALSIGRPVLVPESPTMKEIQAEIGDNWLRTFAGPLSSNQLAKEITWLSARGPVQRPAFIGREWPAIGAAYNALFVRLAREGRRR